MNDTFTWSLVKSEDNRGLKRSTFAKQVDVPKERVLFSMQQAKFITIIVTVVGIAVLSFAGIVVLTTVYVAYSEKLQVHVACEMSCIYIII